MNRSLGAASQDDVRRRHVDSRPPAPYLGIICLFLLSCVSSAPDASHDDLTLHAYPITGEERDYDALLEAAGPAALVLLGESTHGTHEFYRERARITQRLVTEKGFTAVAIEAGWAEVERVDQYVRGTGSDTTAEEALGDFRRFPRWMWRNREFADLVEWIREHNDKLPPDGIKVGVYGIDLYSMDLSVAAVIDHLETIDPSGADEARRTYACFARYAGEPERYAIDVARSRGRSCAAAAREQHDRITGKIAASASAEDRERLFAAAQNARVVLHAEEYYRSQALGAVATWNLRDRHMASTLDHLQRHLLSRQGRDHIVVWAHNSHVGDARATSRANAGELNLGQLVREHWRRELSYIVGFTTFSGSVIAASEWGSSPRRMTLRPAHHRSDAGIYRNAGLTSHYLLMSETATALLGEPHLQRAVGVVYRPDAERQSHYITATPSEQFDAVVFIDATTALSPLESG